MRALFVCVGNACRSPMAESLFNLEATKRGRGDAARSAGLLPHTHVCRGSVEVMRELGVDVSAHKPQLLSPDLVEWADQLILLDREISYELAHLPFAKRNEVLVWDVEDPYGMPVDHFRRVRDHLHRKVEELFDGDRKGLHE